MLWFSFYNNTNDCNHPATGDVLGVLLDMFLNQASFWLEGGSPTTVSFETG